MEKVHTALKLIVASVVVFTSESSTLDGKAMLPAKLNTNGEQGQRSE